MADLIDRQTIIEAIHSAIYPYFCGAEDGDALSEDEKLVLSVNKTICTVIKALPSADVQPVRHGRWIYDRLITTTGGTYGVRRCSECESYYQDVGYGFNYCPHCGALMNEVT